MELIMNTRPTIILFVALAFPSISVASDNEWQLTSLNRAVEQTNFIVGDGCSGTLISLSQKLILTNYHCIDRYISVIDRERTGKDGFVRKVRERRLADVMVEQRGYNGFVRVSSSSYVTEIIADDKKRDLAILKIKTSIPQIYASQILPDGQEIIRGERVYIVGNPAGNDNTVVEGIISNINRTFEFDWTRNEKLPMIQFSGGIYGGNSGGALYNTKGRLIGVPAAGYPSANFIGLAVPADIVKIFMRDHCLASAFDVTIDDAVCRAEKAKKEKSEKSDKPEE